MMPDSINDFEVVGHEYVSPEEGERALARFMWDAHHPDKIGKYPPEIYEDIKVSKD